MPEMLCFTYANGQMALSMCRGNSCIHCTAAHDARVNDLHYSQLAIKFCAIYFVVVDSTRQTYSFTFVEECAWPNI